jgi:hypothetical protein
MHCVECGAEMILVNVIQVQGDATAVAPSVEALLVFGMS